MATAGRALWKGAINFGLVHIPVAMHPATRPGGIDFDWLDRRTLDPVGYRRINKRTGREVAREDIVRGVKTDDGSYVILTEEEIAAVFPKSTRSIDIETFVPAAELPFIYLDRPYYLVPGQDGAKVYALLREALRRTGCIGLARVVLNTKQHLAALVPAGPALVLDLLRWDADVRDWEQFDLPAQDEKAAGIDARELSMAAKLVERMSGHWQPEKFRDSFRDEVMALVEQKAAEAGADDKEEIEPREAPPPPATGQVIDLAELLRRSLRGGSAGAGAEAKGRATRPGTKAAAKTTATATGAPTLRAETKAESGPAAKKTKTEKTAASARKTTARPAAKKQRQPPQRRAA